MFLEACGKFFFSKMRPLFFFILSTLPVLIAVFFLFLKLNQLQDLEERFAAAVRKEKTASERKMRKEKFLQRYSQADPYFLDREIESFPLLQKEKEKLESLLHHPAFPESQSIKNRLAFLYENRLTFMEENIQSSSQIKEVEEKQRRPVQMDEQDLKKILSLIEDIPVDSYTPPVQSPQILIKNFWLKKQETSLQTEVFEVEMNLLKREWINS